MYTATIAPCVNALVFHLPVDVASDHMNDVIFMQLFDVDCGCMSLPHNMVPLSRREYTIGTPVIVSAPADPSLRYRAVVESITGHTVVVRAVDYGDTFVTDSRTVQVLTLLYANATMTARYVCVCVRSCTRYRSTLTSFLRPSLSPSRSAFASTVCAR